MTEEEDDRDEITEEEITEEEMTEEEMTERRDGRKEERKGRGATAHV